jgi:hypothetical protein
MVKTESQKIKSELNKALKDNIDLLTEHTKLLNLQIQVQDKLISGLVRIVTENKITLPKHLLEPLHTLYQGALKEKTDGRKEDKETEGSEKETIAKTVN